jgi:hypothetical protein
MQHLESAFLLPVVTKLQQVRLKADTKILSCLQNATIWARFERGSPPREQVGSLVGGISTNTPSPTAPEPEDKLCANEPSHDVLMCGCVSVASFLPLSSRIRRFDTSDDL